MKAYRSLIGCLLAAFLYALPTAASAQCSGVLSPGYFCGNATAGNALAAGVSPTALFNRAFGTVNDAVLATNGSAVPAFIAIGNCSNALTYSTSTHVFGCNVAVGTGSVTAGGGGVVPTSGSPATLFIEQMTPGGRLTVVSAGCNVTTDQVAQTTLYYAPCGGEWVPVYDGTDMKLRQFTSSATDTVGLSISLASSANWVASTLYDGFVGLDSGTLRLCTGPAWTNSGAGTSARGTGAGTTELQLFKGLWTNKNSMTCRYGAASTFTCAVNQCINVGTFLAGASAGTIDLKFGTAAAGGGLGLLSICNMYNRADTRAASSDTTGSWSYTSATWRAADAGSTKISIVSCMGDIVVAAKYFDLVSPSGTSTFQNISIGLNASNAPAPRATTDSTAAATATIPTLKSWMDDVVPLGLSTIFAIESADGTHATTFNGQSSPFNYMQLSLSARM